jgi:hypothetical protein
MPNTDAANVSGCLEDSAFVLRVREHMPNENKMSDGRRGRASLGVEVWKSSQNVDAQRSAVRSIAWLDGIAWQDLKRCKKVFIIAPCMRLTIGLT